MKNSTVLLSVTAVMFALCTVLIIGTHMLAVQVFFGVVDLFIITLFAFVSTESKHFNV
jgi:hypothetical protein